MKGSLRGEEENLCIESVMKENEDVIKKPFTISFFPVSPSKFQVLLMMHLDRYLRIEAHQTTTGF